MRITGGAWGGRLLKAPKDESTKPSSDRLKESLFNILAHGLGHEMTNVVDFFAGSGALGFEALSRGASQVFFFENNSTAVRCIDSNAALLGLPSAEARYEILSESRIELWPSLLRKKKLLIDTIFCDPPYNKKLLNRTLTAFTPHVDLFAASALWLAELSKSDDLVVKKPWVLHDVREMGSSKIAILKFGT
jgi:16S rRNA (guanine(966)-N(2))-methyltransferase RsmD